MKYVYHVFIAYHGTFNENSSYQKAKKIGEFLCDKGYNVYLHNTYFSAENPEHKDTPWNKTWERIGESKCLLIVINDNVPIKTNGSLGQNSGNVCQIREEIDGFNTLVQKGKRDKHDFNLIYDGDKPIQEQYDFCENLYTPLIAGHNSLLLGNNIQFEDIYKWIKDRCLYIDIKDANIIESDHTLINNLRGKDYHPQYEKNDLFKIIEAKTFSDAYNRTSIYAKNGCRNLLLLMDFDKSELYKEFPNKEGLKRGKILRGQHPSNFDYDVGDIEFAIYHGDYIILDLKDKRIDGYQHVINELSSKPTSRRALISLINTQDIVGSGNKSIPSYILSQYQIKNNYLIVTNYFRALEVDNFLYCNLAEAYIIIKKIVESIPDIKKVFLTFHIFEAYLSEKPYTNIYIPSMDRFHSEYIIIPAIKEKNKEKLLSLLDDKYKSKIYDKVKGFETMTNAIKHYEETGYPESIIDILYLLIETGKNLEE